MILVTGAGGFIGKALCRRLHSLDRTVIAAVRRPDAGLNQFCAGQRTLDLTGKYDAGSTLADCHTVVHLAARVHVMKDNSANPLDAYRAVNVDATLNLARRAAQLKVKRFVFVSTAKVNGELTADKPFSPFDPPDPKDAYALSKWEAEQGLHRIAQETGLQVVIVRPPLVYGPGVQANFLSLLRLIHAGLPLPLAGISNRRSMVALRNLVDLLVVCAVHPAAAGHTFMVSDNHDVSTTELVRMLADAMDKRIILLPIPRSVLSSAARLAGREAAADRLLGSLQIDVSHTSAILGWRPSVGMREALRETASHFLANR